MKIMVSILVTIVLFTACDRKHNCQCIRTEVEKMPNQSTTVSTENFEHKGSATNGEKICDQMNYYHDDQFNTIIVECAFQK